MSESGPLPEATTPPGPPSDTPATPSESAPHGRIAPGPHHVHASYVVVKSLRTLKEMWVALLALAIPAVRGASELPPGVSLVGLGALFCLAVLGIGGYAFASYRRFEWELTEGELHVRQGIVVRKHAHIPFSRIHSLDYRATIVDRALGIVTLRVETAGGSTKAEAEIPALTLSEAEALRAEVFARKQGASAGVSPSRADALDATGAPSGSDGGTAGLGGTGSLGGGTPAADLSRELGRISESARGVFSGTSADDTPIEFEYRLTTRELLIAGLTNSKSLLLVLAAIGGLSQILGYFGADDSILFDLAEGAARQLVALGVLVAVAVVIVALLLAWTISIVATAISYGGFVVRRRQGRVEVERGLLEHRFAGVAIDRIQSVKITQGVLRRALGYSTISLSIVSSLSGADKSGEAQQGLIVHPLIKSSRARAFIAELLPEFAEAPRDLAPLPRRALRRSFFRHTFWLALALAAIATSFDLLAASPLGVPMWLAPLIAAVLLAPGILGGYLAWKNAGAAHDDTMLVLRHGALSLETQIVPRRKIQWARASSSPFQRRAGLGSFSASTAAGVGGQAVGIGDLGAEAAAELLEWARPKTVQRAAIAE